MAYEVSIRGSDSFAKVRKPWAVALLSFFTIYIYAAFWWYFINRELRDLGRQKGSQELGTSPGTSVLAVTLGAFVLVPPIVSTYNTCKRIQAAQRLAGRAEQLNGWIGLILYLLLHPALLAYMQSELNKVWEIEGTPVGQPELSQPPATPPVTTPAEPGAAGAQPPPPAPPAPPPAAPPPPTEPGSGSSG